MQTAAKNASRAAFAVADSQLVKTAVNGCDPNWGRILMALGNAGAQAVQSVASIAIAGVEFYRNGVPVENPNEAACERAMRGASEVVIEICIGSGSGSAEVLASDLSRDYVRLNADYRT